ncbi:MAG TPA: hypothetical protein VF984_02535 [Actinomycetota bacterium]
MRTGIRLLLAASTIAALVAWPAAAALGDATYPSQHIVLHPVADAPLRSGFVENIHPNGPNVYAHEVYVLNGASPDTTYQVTISVFVQDTSCSSTPLQLPTATLVTNASGNAKGQVIFTPADADGLRNATHGAIWTLSSSDGPQYQSDCSTIVLD